MKSVIKIIVLLLALNTTAFATQQKTPEAFVASLQIFYDHLSPYGTWVDYPSYGYVWIPDAGPLFSPYMTSGHWVFTAYGWTWVSDYPWGWAPFHYGRWIFDPIYGWIWVPDTIWGPAWVIWKSSPGYFGWAPLRPGVSITVSFGSGYYVPNDWWVFVPRQYIASPVLPKYYAPRSNNVTILKSTTVINKTYKDDSRKATYVYGPNKDVVEKAIGSPVKTVSIQEQDKPGQSLRNDQLKIYRPQVQKAVASAQKPAPHKLVNLKDMKPVVPKNADDQTKANSSAEVKKQPVQSKKVSPAKEEVEREPPSQPRKDEQIKEVERENHPQPRAIPPPDKDEQRKKGDQPRNPTPPKK